MERERSPNNSIRGATHAFCEYGGTQTRPKHDRKPADMPPVLSGAIGGIRPRLATAHKRDRMPLSCRNGYTYVLKR